MDKKKPQNLPPTVEFGREDTDGGKRIHSRGELVEWRTSENNCHIKSKLWLPAPWTRGTSTVTLLDFGWIPGLIQLASLISQKKNQTLKEGKQFAQRLTENSPFVCG